MRESINDLNLSERMYGSFRALKKTITFDGGTLNGIGDADGTNNPFDIFTVTGNVIVKVIGVCTTDLVGASATISVGVTADTDGILPTTTAPDITAGEIWHDATPDSPIELSSVMVEKIIANGADIIGTVASADITAGVIDFICLWKPISEDGRVETA